MYDRHRARHPRGPRAVALVARPLAHAAARGGARVKAAMLVTVLVLVATAAAGALDVDLQTYDRGVTGTIDGRVYAERPKPNAADVPLARAVVVALPRSEALVRRLDDLRAHARDSAAAYREAATQMRRARESYEREVWQSGAADLVRSTTVDADGRFTLSDLPAGRWMVWATHSEFLDARSPRYQARDRERYRLPPRLVGYYAERAWLREVDTTPGASTTLELNDRNVWFAGVVEDRVLDAGPSR